MPIDTREHTCDGCLWQMSGASKKDLESDGWIWFPIPGRVRSFVLCNTCHARYEPIWAEKTAA